MNKVAIAFVVVILVLIGVYFVTKTPKPTKTVTSLTPTNTTVQQMPEPTTPPPATGAKASVELSTNQTTARVVIDNFAYSPKTITVKAGTSVTWTNNDSAAHTVTSDTGGQFDSGKLATGQSYSHTFTTPGTYSYHCTYHPMMVAQVVVTK